MDELIQLIPFIIIALTLLGRVFLRKKPRELEPEVVLEDEREVTLPPWGNIATTDENTGGPLPDFLELDERSPSPKPSPSVTAAKETRPPPDTTASKPIEPPTLNQAEERKEATPVRTAPRTIAGISLTSQRFVRESYCAKSLGLPNPSDAAVLKQKTREMGKIVG